MVPRPAVGATCPLCAIKLDQLYNYRARKVTRAVIYNGLGVETASDDACPEKLNFLSGVYFKCETCIQEITPGAMRTGLFFKMHLRLVVKSINYNVDQFIFSPDAVFRFENLQETIYNHLEAQKTFY